MTAHFPTFALAVSGFLIALLAVAAGSFRHMRRVSANPSVEALLHRLVALDRGKVELVALHAQTGIEGDEPGSLEDWQIWELLGGLHGLEAMAANCEVLIDLACHVQQWYPEALPIAEQLRLNAREIQWHLGRLQGAESRGNLQSAFPDYAQRAVTIYYGMTQRVLALYDAAGDPGAAQLQAAL